MRIHSDVTDFTEDFREFRNRRKARSLRKVHKQRVHFHVILTFARIRFCAQKHESHTWNRTAEDVGPLCVGCDMVMIWRHVSVILNITDSLSDLVRVCSVKRNQIVATLMQTFTSLLLHINIDERCAHCGFNLRTETCPVISVLGWDVYVPWSKAVI